MRLPFTILAAVAIGAVVWADTVVNVQRRPEVVVTLDADSNTVGVVTGVTYIVEVLPLYRDVIQFDSLADCTANPSIVTNAIRSRCESWAGILKQGWDLEQPIINFSTAEPIITTNHPVQQP